jgi:hypothetical protein
MDSVICFFISIQILHATPSCDTQYDIPKLYALKLSKASVWVVYCWSVWNGHTMYLLAAPWVSQRCQAGQWARRRECAKATQNYKLRKNQPDQASIVALLAVRRHDFIFMNLLLVPFVHGAPSLLLREGICGWISLRNKDSLRDARRKNLGWS